MQNTETTDKFEIYRRVLPSVGPIIFRNFFLLVNGIIFLVVVLDFTFGNTKPGLFLGIVFLLNTFIAITQDIHARVLLEKLQMLTALRVTRIDKDSKEETSVLATKIKKGDLIKLKLGDQTPCEGAIIQSDNIEISEALVTGESDSFPKKEGDKIIAGAVITSGFGIMQAEGLFKDSRMSIIAGEAKKYAASPSSIQTAINTVIKYAGYILLAVLIFVITRGLIIHEPKVDIVTNVGALTSMIVPQGLLVVITLLFAIGAANYSRKNVLFQEINSTEKLGRIKNICIDKTGTLTDNILVVEDMHVVGGMEDEYARSLIYKSIVDLGESSQTSIAVKKYLENDNNSTLDNKKIETFDKLVFSSWRRYGAIEIKEEDVLQTVYVGSGDIMLPQISNSEEKKWLEDALKENAKEGKRVLCVSRAIGEKISKNISDTHLSPLAVFVFHNTLREGITEAVKFFQDRGIRLRVLSGDNALTVQAVAKSVGIHGTEHVVTGADMEKWNKEDFEKHAHEYTIFAQVLPEHKIKLVDAFKKDGFTAMVGDGVNDALAMQKADLGIAMFDGAPVTRQLADVVLMTNSFSSLPGAMEVADHFIRSIEINSGVYINMSLVGLFFFVILSMFGYSYPITPLNITFMNYFTVGFSGMLISYWALRPNHKILPADHRSFLKRIMPLATFAALAEAAVVSLVYFFGNHYFRTIPPSTLAIFAIILCGFLFLIFGASVYGGTLTRREKFQLICLGIFELVVLIGALHIPFILHFFSITLHTL